MFKSLAEILRATVAHLTFQIPAASDREFSEHKPENGLALPAHPSSGPKSFELSRFIRRLIRPADAPPQDDPERARRSPYGH